jgi:hypothetical protein
MWPFAGGEGFFVRASAGFRYQLRLIAFLVDSPTLLVGDTVAQRTRLLADGARNFIHWFAGSIRRSFCSSRSFNCLTRSLNFW